MLLIVSLFATTAVAFAEGEAEEGKHSVTYNAGDHGTGEAPETASYAKGAKVKLAAANTFTADGEYEFAGWKVTTADKTLDKTFKAGEEFEMPDQDVTVTAQWKEPRAEVTINYTELEKYLAEGCAWFTSLKVEMGDVKFGEEMLKDSEKVGKAFPGIIYYDSDDAEYKDQKSHMDKIYVEYCRPSESPKGQETWQNSPEITSSIRLSSSGWYLFRFVVKDEHGEVLVKGDRYYSFYAVDTSRPVVKLSSTMEQKVKSGLTAEAKYSIPTSGLTGGSTDEMSSTTVNFKIYKRVNGAWTADPIYDSKTKEIAKGYEAFVDADGAITPSKADISKNDEAVYKVVYSVTDAYGFSGVESKDNTQKYDALEFNPVMELKVVEAPAESNKSVNVWEIVLFCIAGLSAVGIVVLLCIKPKETAPAVKAKPEVKEDEASEPADDSQDQQ